MPLVRHKNVKRREAQNRAADAKRGTARERGYSTQWDKFARGFLAYNPLCCFCERRGLTVPATVVDHVEPHNSDPELFWPTGDPKENFLPLCKECHDGPKQSAERFSRKSGIGIRDVLRARGLL